MVRFGVIGTNWITDRFLNHSTSLEDFSLTAVYSRTGEKARAFADKYGVENVYTNLNEMAESDTLDAVYIASPNALHAEQAMLFMRHGKHVLCEKPFASNVAEVDAMVKTAKANHVLLMEAMKTTLLPAFEKIKDNIHKIGPVRRYVASFCQYSSRYDAYKEGALPNAFNPTFSNGSLMDLGVYCIYPMVVLFGEPKAIQAMGTLLDSGVDGQGSLLAQYDGMEAIIMHSKITDSYASSEIQGEDGSIIINHISSPTFVKIKYRNGSEDILYQEESEDRSMYYEAAAFIQLLKEGKQESPVNSFEHSRCVAQIIETARRQIGIVYPSDAWTP
ncbi:putative oxidoreductase YulF [Pullulanibacillus camelliae]|uniref:Putative oxidoreductase YulF n=1 Tax=Pullulanibacillus camelliae TaxID=1707096 RepID=A0A8J2YFL5_9BACL|nr:Gfo/Idh/MocA family oxidoreductase [Pullulanibacillus camelliae]GGE29497.1 putative oxidoreductase YulF [Pullulanibacillus camelliae]